MRKKDAGEIIEYYVYQDADLNDFDFIKNVKFDPVLLLNEKLYIQNSFYEFWEIFSNLEKDKIDESQEELNEELSFFNKIANLFITDKADTLTINREFKSNQKIIFPHPRSKI